jgi:hypothetical protein
MNTAHWHLILTHFPIVGSVIGCLILIVGMKLPSIVVKRTSLLVFTFSGVFALAGYQTGEGAEEVVEHLQGVTKSSIETHEELASLYVFLMAGLAALSILTYVADLSKSKFTNALFLILFFSSIGSITYSYQVGISGGRIRHSEIRTTENGAVPDKDVYNDHD